MRTFTPLADIAPDPGPGFGPWLAAGLAVLAVGAVVLLVRWRNLRR